MTNKTNQTPDFIPTRRSLLNRLRQWDDQESWREFFDTYGKLIYSIAIQSGLSDAEAQDAVQETIITVAKTMPGFRYEPAKCHFKTWLRFLTNRRVADQFRKRLNQQPEVRWSEAEAVRPGALEEIPDPATMEPEPEW